VRSRIGSSIRPGTRMRTPLGGRQVGMGEDEAVNGAFLPPHWYKKRSSSEVVCVNGAVHAAHIV
jgi:hypothetical protein